MNKLVVVGSFALALTGCLGYAPVEEHAPVPSTPDMAELPLPTTTPDPPDLGNCGAMEFALQRVEPNVMLVIDRSGSMGDPVSSGSATSKWVDLKNAVSSLVTSYDAQMRLGASIFSSDGNCAAANVDVALAPAAGADRHDQAQRAGARPATRRRRPRSTP